MNTVEIGTLYIAFEVGIVSWIGNDKLVAVTVNNRIVEAEKAGVKLRDKINPVLLIEGGSGQDDSVCQANVVETAIIRAMIDNVEIALSERRAVVTHPNRQIDVFVMDKRNDCCRHKLAIAPCARRRLFGLPQKQ